MEKGPEKAWWQPGLAVFGEITGWLVAPIVASLFLGKYLDRRFDSEPWFYLGLTAAAFAVTVVGLLRIGSRYIKQVEDENPSVKDSGLKNKEKKKNLENERNDKHIS